MSLPMKKKSSITESMTAKNHLIFGGQNIKILKIKTIY